jgi:cell division protein ZapA
MERSESVTVTIFGREYTLKGAADPEYVRRIAAFVDERMGEVARSGAVGATERVAILAAVNIADELFREQRKRIESEAGVEDRTVHIARLLAKEVGEGPTRGNGGDSLPGT